MADTLGVTLSHADQARKRVGQAEPRPVLVLALECSRPQALSARWSLAGLAAVHLGRGQARVPARASRRARGVELAGAVGMAIGSGDR